MITNLDNFLPNHPDRLRIYTKFYNILRDFSHPTTLKLTDTDIKKMALNIERGLFNYAVLKPIIKEKLSNKLADQGVKVEKSWDTIKDNYIMKAVTIYTNINPDTYLKNTNLINRLLSREFSEFDLINMTPDKLFPERHQKLLDEIERNKPVEQKVTEDEDGVFRCGKCAAQKRPAYKTSYYQMQTRSAKIIGWKSILLITYWLCYWKNSCSPILMLRC
jgi:DNA-directed RNA polymerase subunit M/transcription elongation factor TFIIS